MRRLCRVLLLATLAACAPQPPREAAVVLPPTAQRDGIGDPTRGAILSTAYVFGRPASVAGDPAAAAEALGRLEYLTTELDGGRWQDLDPLVVPMLRRGRAEARAAFGLDPAAAPQRAADALFGAAAALRAGDRGRATQALAPVTGAERADGTLQRLAALPYLPEATAATSRAQSALSRRDQDSGRDWRR